MSNSIATAHRSASEDWSDGLPIVAETPALIDQFLKRADLGAEDDVGAGLLARQVAVQAIRAGCKSEYLPVIVAAIEAVLDPAFHIEHLCSPLSAWPAFVVNGPIIKQIDLYSGVYVLSSGRQANAAIGRAISLVLGNFLPKFGDGGGSSLGNAARMAGLVIAEKEDTPWEPLSVMLGHSREDSTVTAFSSFQGSPMQVLPLGTRFMSAPPIAALFAEHCSEGWCGPGTQLILLSPNAQREFLAEGWSKFDLRSYLLKNTRISVAQLKRLRRWMPAAGEVPSDEASAPILAGDEERFLRLADAEIWTKIHPAPGQNGNAASAIDFLPVVAGSEVAHMYTSIFYPYPVPPPKPVTKRIKVPA